MPKLLIVAALLISGIGTYPATGLDTSSRLQAQQTVGSAQTAETLDPQKKAWFERAVEHMLDDASDEGKTP